MLRRLSSVLSITAAFLLGALAIPAAAQQAPSVDVGGHVTVLNLGEFDTTDTGAGVQASVNLTRHFAIDGLLSLFPGRDGGDGSAVEGSRKSLGLIGIRAGQQLGRVQLYARARPGFLNFSAQDNVACVLIIPPPLSCVVAEGYTAFAAEIGGGVRVRLSANDRLHLNVDAGDLLVRYAADEPFRRDSDFAEVDESLLTHNLLFNAGVSWRF